MPFRNDDNKRGADVDPLERFFELEEALCAEFGLDDVITLRLAAANLVASPDDAIEIVRRVRALARELSPIWQIPLELKLLLAALILQREDQPLALIAEVERVRAMMRDLGMRRLRMERKKRYEFIAIVVMRFHGGLTPIEMDRVRRLHAIHEQMKWHHWWLTGPDDYPACALLSGQDRSPEDIAARANAIYDGLSQRGSAWRGDPLQTASNVLALSLLEPNELVDRFATLLKKFDRDGPIRMSRDEYDEVAVLCFLAQPCDLIVETVTGYARTMYARLRWPDSTRTFGLATNLAFAHLLGNDPELGALADLKVLLDMQELLIAREGAEA